MLSAAKWSCHDSNRDIGKILQPVNNRNKETWKILIACLICE